MASRKNSPTIDPDNPEWTADDFARAKKPEEILPADVLAQFGKRRGPQKSPTKIAVSIRLSPIVINYFRDKGPGWQSRIDKILTKVATGKTAAKRSVASHSKRRRA
jgi:uncharacterized protein (DUF4415 family)